MTKQKNKDKEKENKQEAKAAEEAAENTEAEEKPAEAQKEAAPEEVKENSDDKLRELEKKLSESEDRYKRLYAEFDNYQKRTAKEKDARYADAVIDTVEAFLQVEDNLERAMAVKVESEDAKKVLEGVALVQKQMKDTLAKLKVTEIKAVGEEFDPNIHNAVMHVDDDSVTDNTVVEEFLKGYIYNNDRVVRHSMVKVAN